jgi:hypothetical protein
VQTIRLNHDVVNFTYITDAHMSATPLGRRQATYASEILAKFEFVREVTEKLNGVCLNGGDVYHAKNPASPMNTHALNTRLIECFGKFPLGRHFGNHGNHDLWGDRPDSIPKQPLGVLLAAGVYQDLSLESVVFENKDGSIRVQVDAFPYSSDDIVTLNRVLTAPPREAGVTYRIVILHQYGNPGNQGSMFGHPTIGFNQMADCDYDIALWGHDHSRCEVVTVGNTTHIRLGSLSRASIAEDEANRPVSVAVLSCTSERIKFVEKQIPVRPLVEAFTEGSLPVERVTRSADVLQFFASVDQAVGAIEFTDPREVLRSLCPVEDKTLLDLTFALCGL